MKAVLLIVAIAFICIAHLIRTMRWSLFIRIYEKPNTRNLIQCLSVGYLVNYIVPYKLGDILRAWFSGKRMKNGKALAFSTVIVDRYLDIIVVGLIFVVLFFRDESASVIKETVIFYISAAVSLFLLTIFIYYCRGFVKRILRLVAGLFNPDIEAFILRFAWALIWNFKDIFCKISKTKLIGSTIGMWVAYLLSYVCFAEFLKLAGNDMSWTDIFTMLFAQSNITLSTSMISGGENSGVDSIFMLIYIISPLIIMFVLSTLFLKKEIEKEDSQTEYLNLLPHLDPKERLNFLENYFSNKNRLYIENYLKINQGISIIRDYSAGSNATTMLCMDSEKTFFRKYAFGEDGEKLYQQVQWIEENSKILPLPYILRCEKNDIYCYYDMPYSANSVGLFEYVHSMPLEKGWLIIQRALECLEGSVYKINTRKADPDTIARYIREKVNKNIKIIKNAKRIKALLQYDSIVINGIKYKNLQFYEKYLTEEFLTTVFANDMYAIIHGDLTIENIICQRDESGKDDFYIIDPNTGNIHDSPNLDYGKLLQSIHGGYEFLMSIQKVKVQENKINFLFTKSSIYVELHECLRKYMMDTFGIERTKSIYFHEIIHWLRLMPYKIAKDEKKALMFYAGMLMVMNDVIRMFENPEGRR